jgi:hypothetical protein
VPLDIEPDEDEDELLLELPSILHRMPEIDKLGDPEGSEDEKGMVEKELAHEDDSGS